MVRVSGLCLLLLPSLLSAADFAEERRMAFMHACMLDATVAAGQRETLCHCLYNALAYKDSTRFGVSDAMNLDERVWEAPDRRLPTNSLGLALRELRQNCMRESR